MKILMKIVVKNWIKTAALVLAAFSVSAKTVSLGGETELLGQYVEMTTRGVFFGPDREVSGRGIGDFAILGWSVAQGTWLGEDLSGLRVVAAVRIDGSLDELEKSRIKAVLYVDKRANEKQALALRSMAQQLAKKYLKNVVDVQAVPIALEMVQSRENEDGSERSDAGEAEGDAPAHEDSGDAKSGLLKLEIGKLLSVHARMFDDHAECACGKSQKKIESLATTRERQHARTVKNFFKASGIQIGKDRPGRTQALLGTFSL